MTSSSKPAGKSEQNSPTRSVNSPEFRKEMAEELKDWVRKGHCKLAPGNTIEDRNSPNE